MSTPRHEDRKCPRPGHVGWIGKCPQCIDTYKPPEEETLAEKTMRYLKGTK